MLSSPGDREGRRTVPVPIVWAQDAPPPYVAVHVNTAMQRVTPLSQICGLYVDNTLCDVDVSILFPDTQFHLLAPAGAQGYFPVTTGGRDLFAWPLEEPRAGDQTVLQILNFLPPPGVLTSKWELTDTPSPPLPETSEALPSAFRYKGLWRISGFETPGYQAPMAIPATAFPAVPFVWAPQQFNLSAFFVLRPGTGALPPSRPTGSWLVGVFIEDAGDGTPAAWRAVATFNFANFPSLAQRQNVLWYAIPTGDQPTGLTGEFAYIDSPPPGQPIWTVLQCTTVPTGPASDMQIGINATILDYPLTPAIAVAPDRRPTTPPPLPDGLLLRGFAPVQARGEL